MSTFDALRPARETPRLRLPIPGDASPADYVSDTGAIADRLDAGPAAYLQGTLENRPRRGRAGRLYYATDADAPTGTPVPPGSRSRRPAMLWAVVHSDRRGRLMQTALTPVLRSLATTCVAPASR